MSEENGRQLRLSSLRCAMLILDGSERCEEGEDGNGGATACKLMEEEL